jgi:hypothetical protein
MTVGRAGIALAPGGTGRWPVHRRAACATYDLAAALSFIHGAR